MVDHEALHDTVFLAPLDEYRAGTVADGVGQQVVENMAHLLAIGHHPDFGALDLYLDT